MGACVIKQVDSAGERNEEQSCDSVQRLSPEKDQRDAEDKAKRLLLHHAIKIAVESLKATEGESIPITVGFHDGHEVQETVKPGERAIALKLRLYEEKSTGSHPVAPPTVARLTMGGLEVADDDTFETHDVAAGVKLMLSFEPPIYVVFGNKEPAATWGDELMENVLRRLDLPSEAWLLHNELVGVTKTMAENGFTDGAVCRRFQLQGTITTLVDLAASNEHVWSDSQKYMKGCLATDGCLYVPPRASRDAIKVDAAGAVSFISCPDMLCNNPGWKWSGAAQSYLDGRIYCSPHQASHVLCIDPKEGRAYTIGNGDTTMAVNHKWGDAVAADDGMVYCIPCEASQVLRIDPTTQTTSLIGPAIGAPMAWGGCLANDGNIYGIPLGNVQPLCIDVANQTAYLFGQELSSAPFSWCAGVLARDGCIYCVPFGASHVLRIDPTTKTTTLVGTEHGDGLKWGGGVCGPDGWIYAPPFDAAQILAFNPVTHESKKIGEFQAGGNKWISSVLTPGGGGLYFVPCNAGLAVIV